MKKTYMDLMEKVLSAYAEEEIYQYYSAVKKGGITEHGFPRLTANIGILIANERKMHLYKRFLEMMDLCCEEFLKPKKVNQGNDFSVKEIIFCMMELEKTQAVPPEKIASWKNLLAKINYKDCYNVYAASAESCCHNWALFTAVSEFMRGYIHAADTRAFVDVQISSQLKRLDENRMYRDADYRRTNPMVYDIVPRGLFCVLMHFGYQGRYRSEIDQCLKEAGLLTLDMQSVSGELPYGGRSNQFLHNEAQLALVLEYEADRYYKEGNLALAGRFKAGAVRAAADIEKWLSREVITHIKNNYPIESRMGCEAYAYFDKYMITAASYLYVAYLFCNDAIIPVDKPEAPKAFSLSRQFHKTFLKNGRFFVEIETDADTHYDANGIGRIHCKGVPSAICLSVPGTASPNYTSVPGETIDFSIAPGVADGEEILFAAGENAEYILKDRKTTAEGASVQYDCHFSNWKTVSFSCEIGKNSVAVNVSSHHKNFLMLPAFYTDGRLHSRIKHKGRILEVSYDGCVCRYESACEILPLGKRGFNRNGEYQIFYTAGDQDVSVKIEFAFA